MWLEFLLKPSSLIFSLAKSSALSFSSSFYCPVSVYVVYMCGIDPCWTHLLSFMDDSSYEKCCPGIGPELVSLESEVQGSATLAQVKGWYHWRGLWLSIDGYKSGIPQIVKNIYKWKYNWTTEVGTCQDNYFNLILIWAPYKVEYGKKILVGMLGQD